MNSSFGRNDRINLMAVQRDILAKCAEVTVIVLYIGFICVKSVICLAFRTAKGIVRFSVWLVRNKIVPLVERFGVKNKTLDRTNKTCPGWKIRDSLGGVAFWVEGHWIQLLVVAVVACWSIWMCSGKKPKRYVGGFDSPPYTAADSSSYTPWLSGESAAGNVPANYYAEPEFENSLRLSSLDDHERSFAKFLESNLYGPDRERRARERIVDDRQAEINEKIRKINEEEHLRKILKIEGVNKARYFSRLKNDLEFLDPCPSGYGHVQNKDYYKNSIGEVYKMDNGGDLTYVGKLK